MPQSNIKIYSFRRCPFAIRARMVLHEKNLLFETIEEDLKNFSPELKKLHPEAKVPLLVHDNEVIYESAIITEFLDEKYPEPALMPESPELKMHVRRWTYWCNFMFKPEIDRFKYGGQNLTEEEMNTTKEKLTEYMAKLEDGLANSEWFVGNQFSLADIHVFPFFRQLSKATPPHPDIDGFPKAKAWLERILARPSFEKTMAKV